MKPVTVDSPVRRSLTIRAGTAMFLAWMALSPQWAGANTVPVNEANATWTWAHEGGVPPESFGFVTGPATPPSGSGSLHVRIHDGDEDAILKTTAYAGMPLANITAFSYWIYQYDTPLLSPLTAVVEFDIDYDDTDCVETSQGRLFYEPYARYPFDPDPAPIPNQWLFWDMLVGDAMEPGMWWGDGSPIVGGKIVPTHPFGRSNPATWAKVLAEVPHARIKAVDGILGIKVGAGYALDKDWYADALRINTQPAPVIACDPPLVPPIVGDITWDFETLVGADVPVLVSRGSLALGQTIPSPVRSHARIRFTIPHQERITLTLHDLAGRKIASLLDGVVKSAGTHEVAVDARDLPEGCYFYRLSDGRVSLARRMVVIQ